MLEVARSTEWKVRVVLVGYGTIGSARARWYLTEPRIALVAVVDPLQTRRDAAARELGAIPTYASLEEALERQQLDLVDICSPPVFHAPQIEAAVTRGHHVMCEKPVIVETATGIRLWNLAMEHARVIYPIHNYVFSPTMKMLMDVARAPGFGTLVAGEFAVARPIAAQGVSEWYPNWRRDPAVAGGGILFDHGTHCIYMATRLAGRAPARVACTLHRPDGPDGTEDSVSLQMDFGELTWRIDLTWRAESRENRYRIAGTHGSIDVRGDQAHVVLRGEETIQSVKSSTSADSTHLSWLEPLVGELIDVLDQRSSAERFWEAVVTTHIVEVAYASAAQGGVWLPLDEDLTTGCPIVPAFRGAANV